MAVPTWAAIADAELNPEAPITSSLMYRLRDQYAAILGVDPTSLTQPLFSVPASQIILTDASLDYADPGTAAYSDSTTTGAEVRLCRIASSMEMCQLAISGDIAIDYNNDGNPIIKHHTEVFMGIEYTAGSPSGAKFIISADASDSIIDRTTYIGNPFTLPLNNTYQTVLRYDYTTGGYYGILKMKARATTTDIYLQIQAVSVGSGGYSRCNGTLTRREFAAKG